MLSSKPVTLYSLDMVISVGYRVSSKQATLFRKWATDKFVQFATKGFVIDAARLKNPQNRDRIGRVVLHHGGSVAMTDARRHAEQEYAKFKAGQKSLRHAQADKAIAAIRSAQDSLKGGKQ